MTRLVFRPVGTGALQSECGRFIVSLHGPTLVNHYLACAFERNGTALAHFLGTFESNDADYSAQQAIARCQQREDARELRAA